MIPLFSREARHFVRDSFGPIPEPKPGRVRIQGLGGKRLRHSQDREGMGLVQSALAITAPAAPAERWRDLDLSSRTLDRISATDLIELLADVSPDVSRALWDFLRICNPGHEATVLRPSGSPAPQSAQRALDDILATIAARHGDLKVVINRLFLAAFLRGGFAAELVLDMTGRRTLDLATPDPATLRWREVTDPELGTFQQVGQLQAGEWVSLDIPTFGYIPIDPLPGKPYGRAPANPAIFPTLFALAMLHDVRRVVQQQGYPRLDLEVTLEKLAAAMPEDIQPGTEEYQEWLSSVISDISTYYAELEPDDAYVHTDVVKVNRPVGAVGADSLGAIPKLIEVLERQAIRALKTAPLLMGITDGVSEANANRQVDLFLMSVRSLQQLAENLLERLLTLALQAQGVAGIVRFRFAEAQGLQRLRNAQVSEIEARVARAQYDAGWISQDEAARRGAGVEQADAPAPRAPTAPPPPATEPTPDEDRPPTPNEDAADE